MRSSSFKSTGMMETIRRVASGLAISAAILAGAGAAQGGGPAKQSIDNLLALTWQPAFCEHLSDTEECVQLNNGQLPVAGRQLSLHGLWPQPRGNDYCGVEGSHVALDKKREWRSLPALPLDTDTRSDLAVAMPGMASFLHRHEWVKHGTCYFAAGGADEYFDDSLYLAAAVNRSAVGRFLAENVGNAVDTADIRARFDEAFGPGAGSRVGVTCRKDGTRVLIRELRIALRGIVTPDVSPGDLMRAALPVPAGCERGILDPAGLQ